MSDQFELTARIRARTGTGLVRRLRKEGDVPAILYGAGGDNLSIAINHDVLYHSLEKEEFHSAIIVINTDGNKEQAILRDVQRHPQKSNILHADFQRIDNKQLLTMSMPIHFIGEEDCIGVKSDGGIVSHLINDVEIVCLPGDLPEVIELDVTNLHVGESLNLSDIKLPEGVNITTLLHDENNEHDYAVVSISVPREIVDEDEDTVEEVTLEGEEEGEATETQEGGEESE